MKLTKINLRKAVEHNCPTIKVGSRYTYLCKIGSLWLTGYFNRQWYSLNFELMDGGNVQFDAPGFNSSEWKSVYQIRNK